MRNSLGLLAPCHLALNLAWTSSHSCTILEILPRQNFWFKLIPQNLMNWATVWWKLHDRNFVFDWFTSVTDGHTDGWTDRQMDGWVIAYSALSIYCCRALETISVFACSSTKLTCQQIQSILTTVDWMTLKMTAQPATIIKMTTKATVQLYRVFYCRMERKMI